MQLLALMTDTTPVKRRIGSGVELYADKTIWSQQYKLWHKFRVKKPRLPKHSDNIEVLANRWNDTSRNKPSSLTGFVGLHNEVILRALKNLRETFEDNKMLPDCIIIHGSSGCGKTSMVEAFAQELAFELNLTSVQLPKWLFYVDCSLFLKDPNKLFKKINLFNEAPIDRCVTIPYRLLIIDNADMIPPSYQQTLKKIMEVSFMKGRYIFICTDPTKMVAYIQAKAITMKARSCLEKDALTIILGVCYRNKIGYDRDGVHELFRIMREEISLSHMIDMLQRVFFEQQFISRENVIKASGIVLDISPIPPSRAVEMPLIRCQICTLYPPCKHLSEETMGTRGAKQRGLLPRYQGGMTCPEFLRYGYCTIFNRHGHCSLDHPKDVHRVIAPSPRCPRCSITWPCNHCNFTANREKFLHAIKVITERLHRLRQLTSEDPPLALTVKLDEKFVGWRLKLIQIEKIFATPEREAALADAAQWLECSYCVEKEDYEVKCRVLRKYFGELYKSELLRDYSPGAEAEEEDTATASRATTPSKSRQGTAFSPTRQASTPAPAATIGGVGVGAMSSSVSLTESSSSSLPAEIAVARKSATPVKRRP